MDAQRLAEARLRAKANQQERDRLARASSTAEQTFARRGPLQAVSADSTSPTAPSTRSFPSQPFASGSGSVRDASSRLHRVTASPAPSVASTSTDTGVSTRSKSAGASALPRDPRLGNYVEYDLSTLKNSKGGFLITDEGDDEHAAKQRQIVEDLRKERMREAERQGLDGQHDPLLGLRSGEDAPRCEICKSVELDLGIFKTYGVPVCPKDRNDHPDRYSLLTKTECKEDYLLTDPELRDTDILPHMLKKNPHRATYSNMMLFLRQQVEAYAFKKWGSAEALDAEFARRTSEKKRKRNAKFEASLKKLRRGTRENKYHARQDADHAHEFGDALVTDADGQQWQVCSTCGFEVECETL